MQENKITAVVDTNVIISGLINESNTPGLVLENWIEREYDLAVSQSIISELKEVINYDKLEDLIDMTDLEKLNFIKRVKANSLLVEVNKGFKVLEDDPDDNKFFNVAVLAEADYIVSGDNLVLEVERFKDIKVVTPAEFLEILQNSKIK